MKRDFNSFWDRWSTIISSSNLANTILLLRSMVHSGEHPAADGEVSEEEEAREWCQYHPQLHPLPDAPGDSSRDSALPVVAAPDALPN